MPERTPSLPRRRLRAVDVERLENTSFAGALGLGGAPAAGSCVAFSCQSADTTAGSVPCNACTVASCVGITCTGGGQCVSAGACVAMTVTAHPCDFVSNAA